MNAIDIDENLIVLMGKGNDEAFRKLYLATSDALYGYALSILRNKNDAEDVMHDAYIKIYQNAASYRPLGKPLAWMLTIVRNLSYNKMQSGDTLAEIDERSVAAVADEGSNSLDRIVLEKALQILDLQERQIVVLHAITGFKHREIAQVLGLPTGTVLSKYHRALKRLRAALAEEEETR